MGKLRICRGFLGKWCEVILFTVGPHGIHVKEHANIEAADEQPYSLYSSRMWDHLATLPAALALDMLLYTCLRGA
jgi:hypothetical protein